MFLQRRPARPTNPVHIILRIFWKRVVDHVADTVDMDTSSRDIGRHQNPGPTLLETVECLCPLPLRDLAAQQGRVDSILNKSDRRDLYTGRDGLQRPSPYVGHVC